MAKVLGFTAAVLATVGAVYGVTVLAMSLEPVAKMPAAEPIYESRADLKRLRSPCELPYAHRNGNGQWVRGCAK